MCVTLFVLSFLSLGGILGGWRGGSVTKRLVAEVWEHKLGPQHPYEKKATFTHDKCNINYLLVAMASHTPQYL